MLWIRKCQTYNCHKIRFQCNTKPTNLSVNQYRALKKDLMKKNGIRLKFPKIKMQKERN